MTIKTNTLSYHEGNTNFEAYYAHLDTADKRPLVLVVHDWSGRNAFACNTADKLAELGYVGFAVDLYGQAKVVQTKEEKSAMIAPLMQDRRQIVSRLQAALAAASTLPFVDATRVAAIGFCFGGLCVLDFARSGAAVKGIVSFHGLLNAPDYPAVCPIPAKVLALHGYEDPMATPQQAIAFADEMTKAQADWQIHFFGQTLHAFMNPEANDREFGTVYDAKIAKRAWGMMRGFLEEVCGF